MEQFEIVLETPEGMSCTIIQQDNKKLIIRLEPNSPVPCEGQDKATYFTKITQQHREQVKKWLKGIKGQTNREKRFLERVNQAVQKVNYEYWIATIEPSVDGEEIFYAENKDVGRGFSANQWKQMAKSYAPERGSRLASLDELFIWYALRIVNKFWTLDYVANDSSSAGNYRNSPDTSHDFEKTGARKCGGYCDGQGNTYKIVTVGDGYALVGGGCDNNGDYYPVADVGYFDLPSITQNFSSGVLALTK